MRHIGKNYLNDYLVIELNSSKCFWEDLLTKAMLIELTFCNPKSMLSIKSYSYSNRKWNYLFDYD